MFLATRSLVATNLGVYPNRTQNRLNVPHTAASRDARVTVFRTTGARVASFSAQPGTTETAVDLSNLSRGLYLVEYADGGQRSSARIAKE
nr:T9SS type A sorting domain-containing protein [Hymenobacter siberiensis]